MPHFAANLSMMYREHEFFDRFAAAAHDGFTAVEFLFPYDYSREKLASLLQENGLRQVFFNSPPGDRNAGERGCAALPGREQDFRGGFEWALDYARALVCPRVHVMAGLLPEGADRPRFRATYVANLAWAAERAQSAGIDLLIEPIAHRNLPGSFLNRQDEAHAIVAEIGKPNLKVMLNYFHCQVEEGDLAFRTHKYLSEQPCRVGHIQIAGVPECHEPDTGEVNYAYLFDLIDQLGYQGFIGCEYLPAAATSEGLNWFRERNHP